MKNAKQKGNRYENQIAKRLSKSLGVDLRRNPGSGNMENWKGDIVAIEDKDRMKFPWCIELKNQKKLMIPAWIRQVEEEAKEMKKKPVLIFHMHNSSDDYAVVKLSDWEKLVKKNS